MENVNEPAQDVRKEEDNGDDNEEDVNPDLEEEVAKNEGKAEEEEAFPGKENNGAIEAVLIGRDKWKGIKDEIEDANSDCKQILLPKTKSCW